LEIRIEYAKKYSFISGRERSATYRDDTFTWIPRVSASELPNLFSLSCSATLCRDGDAWYDAARSMHQRSRK
jgi:hypothetical protein